MGCSSSKPDILQIKDGDGKDFLEKYAVGKILGSGEFGVVKLVYLKNDPVGPRNNFSVKETDSTFCTV